MVYKLDLVQVLKAMLVAGTFIFFINTCQFHDSKISSFTPDGRGGRKVDQTVIWERKSPLIFHKQMSRSRHSEH